MKTSTGTETQTAEVRVHVYYSARTGREMDTDTSTHLEGLALLGGDVLRLRGEGQFGLQFLWNLQWVEPPLRPLDLLRVCESQDACTLHLTPIETDTSILTRPGADTSTHACTSTNTCTEAKE